MKIAVYIILGILVLFFGFQKLMVFRMTRNKGKPAPRLKGARGKAVSAGKPALFYFYSPSCNACKAMTPVVEKYTKNNPRCFKIDISKDMETARAFGVLGTPSTIITESGIIKEFIVGPKPKSELVKLLERTKN